MACSCQSDRVLVPHHVTPTASSASPRKSPPETRRLHGRVSAPDDFCRYLAHSVPRARRRKPRPHGLEHAASGCAFAAAPTRRYVGTGIEHRIAVDSGEVLVAQNPGVVDYVDGQTIIILNDDGEYDEYLVPKFQRSNQSGCINHKPIVRKGDEVACGRRFGRWTQLRRRQSWRSARTSWSPT